MKVRAQVVACAVILGGASIAAAAPEMDPGDEKEVQAVRAKSPHAAELLEKGEALAALGQEAGADALFAQALGEYRGSSLLWRRHCEARTALGPRNVAIQACTQALELSRSDLNFRALVSSFVDGPVPPTTTEIAEALIITASPYKEGAALTAAAAACDIAERIGDRTMLQRCTEELARLAPNDPATQKAMSRLSAQCPPWRFWIGWLAIALAVVTTLGDAMIRLVRRWPKRRASVVAVAVVSAALSSVAGLKTALADQPASSLEATPQHGWLSKWTIDRDDPSAHIPSEHDRNAEPLQFGYWLQDLVWKAEHASKTGDHVQATKYYTAMATAVPDRAIGFTRACEEYEAMGELDHAINACAQGLLRDGVLVKDYTHFVHLVLAKPELAKKDKDAIAVVMAHMREDPAGRDFVDELECDVGVRTSNVAQLRECTAALAASGASGSKFLAYQWNLAVQEGKFGLARELVTRIRDSGTMPPDRIADMLKVTSSREKSHWTRVALVVFALALLSGGVGVAVRAIRRRRAASDSGPTPPAENAPVAG
jgi:tetratricopeptide (TPR) repeat protein